MLCGRKEGLADRRPWAQGELVINTQTVIAHPTTPVVLTPPSPPPQVHLKLHIVTSAVYATPSATVCARLLVRVLDDLLLPLAYPAELAGTSYSLSTGTGGLLLKVEGFTGVAQQLMVDVLAALKGGRRGGEGGQTTC